MRVIFMGTPDFAVPTLRLLHESGYDIVGVITSTDKYGGRGRKQLLESDVKKEAMRLGLHILQPPRLKNKDFIKELSALKADVQIVVAFRMLPEVVWDMPEMGTYNIHGSLLPKYRGAAPIHWAVIQGERITGVTSFKLKHEIDTGSIYGQKEMTIGPNDTTGYVYNKMKYLGAELALDTIQAIEAGNINLREQVEDEVTKAPKIYHDTCEIDFNRSSQDIHNHIRGLSPFPLAWTSAGAIEIKVIKAEISEDHPYLSPGVWASDNKSYLYIGTQDKPMKILDLKVSGKRAMTTAEFLRGQDLIKWQEVVQIIIE